MASAQRWTVVVEAASPRAIEPAFRLAMEVDPRVCQVRLCVRPATGGGAELWYRAIYRHLFAVETDDWEPVRLWLIGAEASVFLQTIRRGYRHEMTWSGDVIGHWTDEATSALEAVVGGVEKLVD